MTVTKSFRSIIILAVAVFALLGYNFLGAWTVPAGAPPTNNVPAPINAGATAQQKTGNFMAKTVAAGYQMRADLYCNTLGTVCLDFEDLVGAGGGNETVWLTTPQTAFAPAQFKSNSKVTKTLDATVLGLPSNVVSLYILAEHQGAVTYHESNYVDDTYLYTIPGLSYKKPLATVFTPMFNNGGQQANTLCTGSSGVAPNGTCYKGVMSAIAAGTHTEWIEVVNNKTDIQVQCNAGCGNGGSKDATITIKVAAYECDGKCTP